jgi:hypothetical protein
MTKIYVGQFDRTEKEFVALKNKYEKLIEFIKNRAKLHIDGNRVAYREDQHEIMEARDLLAEIGEHTE